MKFLNPKKIAYATLIYSILVISHLVMANEECVGLFQETSRINPNINPNINPSISSNVRLLFNLGAISGSPAIPATPVGPRIVEVRHVYSILGVPGVKFVWSDGAGRTNSPTSFMMNWAT